MTKILPDYVNEAVETLMGRDRLKISTMITLAEQWVEKNCPGLEFRVVSYADRDTTDDDDCEGDYEGGEDEDSAWTFQFVIKRKKDD